MGSTLVNLISNLATFKKSASFKNYYKNKKQIVTSCKIAIYKLCITAIHTIATLKFLRPEVSRKEQKKVEEK